MSRQDRSVLGWGAFIVAVAALGLALFGLRESSSAEGGSSGSSGPTVVEVSLTEWAITPNMVYPAAGEVILRVKNDGTMVHNLSIPALGKKTSDLAPGASEDLELGTVPAGDYDMLCEIAGHAASGMTGQMMVGDGGFGSGDGMDMGGSGGEMTWQEMDRIMDVRNLAFPAKTEGKGGQLLEPRLENGVKVYDITASIVDWEVEPGKIVKAWTYNGVVPAPEIRVNVGDKVRINFKNELTESTAIHFHGIRVPWNMDGVPPYTQHQVEPGKEFVYEFEALEPSVGIYHSHHNAQLQVPNGLFGGFFIGEMPIPDYLKDKGYTKIDKRVTMVLNDAGTIGLSLNGKSFPATEPYTLRKGEVMEVTYLNEGLMAHPMHLHQPVGWISAKDGVPLDFPIPGDTINVAPGERYTVLYKAVDEGIWAWHCHILNHAEGPQGMFGMVTALIVEQ